MLQILSKSDINSELYQTVKHVRDALSPFKHLKIICIMYEIILAITNLINN